MAEHETWTPFHSQYLKMALLLLLESKVIPLTSKHGSEAYHNVSKRASYAAARWRFLSISVAIFFLMDTDLLMGNRSSGSSIIGILPTSWKSTFPVQSWTNYVKLSGWFLHPLKLTKLICIWSFNLLTHLQIRNIGPSVTGFGKVLQLLHKFSLNF